LIFKLKLFGAEKGGEELEIDKIIFFHSNPSSTPFRASLRTNGM